MAHYKRKRRKWSTACGLCKSYKRWGGNGTSRTEARYLKLLQGAYEA